MIFYLMENNVKNFSLELTCHGKITGKNNQLIFDENNIIARVREPDEFIDFFSEGLGFKNLSDNNLTFKSINRGVVKSMLREEIQKILELMHMDLHV